MFDIATRKKLRFSTSKGDISVEDLWDLPRFSERGLSLKSIAKKLLVQLKDLDVIDEFDEKDEVESEETATIKLKLDIVRHILKVKLEEAEVNKNRAKVKEHNQLILSLIEKKQMQNLESLSVEELQGRLQ